MSCEYNQIETISSKTICFLLVFYAYLLICQASAERAPAVKELKSICSQFMSDPLRLPFTLLKIEPFAADLCQTLSRAAFYKAQILKQICWCFAHKVDRAEAFVRCVKQMAGVLLHKHCHRVRHSWPTWEAAEVDAASNFSRCGPNPQGGTFRERCRVVVDPAIFLAG